MREYRRPSARRSVYRRPFRDPKARCRPTTTSPACGRAGPPRGSSCSTTSCSSRQWSRSATRSASSPNLGRIGAVDAAFAATWLIWLATTLHANRFRDDGAVQRALVLVQMLLLTVNAVAVGDGFDAHPAAHLGDVRVARDRRGSHVRARGARTRRRPSTGCVASQPVLRGRAPDPRRRVHPEAARVVLWVVGVALLTWPTLGFRFGRYGSVPPFDEQHFVERLGLLTIIVCGESFVKVSLLAADGSLDGIDLAVLVTMFVFVFGVWWGYFDDVPKAGLRPATDPRHRLAARAPAAAALPGCRRGRLRQGPRVRARVDAHR